MTIVIILVHRLINLCIIVLLIRAVISWVAPMSRHPAVVLLNRATDRFLDPIRKRIGPQGGVDFSVLILMVILYIVDALVIGLLR